MKKVTFFIEWSLVDWELSILSHKYVFFFQIESLDLFLYPTFPISQMGFFFW